MMIFETQIYAFLHGSCKDSNFYLYLWKFCCFDIFFVFVGLGSDEVLIFQLL